jgi:hypothetical protein
MKKRPHLFLSYSRKDTKRVEALEKAFKRLDVPIWRDVRSIAGGQRWSPAIEKGIRDSRGVLVLVTPASVTSEWVLYEYAFATGAGIPIVAVVAPGVPVPKPIQQFQEVKYTAAQK